MCYYQVMESKNNKSKKTNTSELARKSMLIVIIAVIIAVIAGVGVGLYFRPENSIKREIASLAEDYYENYYYKGLETAAGGEKIDLSKWANVGFAAVTVRHLVLYDNGKNAAHEEKIAKYCDLSKSSIVIYPDAPYGQKNYHIKYNLSCKFD